MTTTFTAPDTPTLSNLTKVFFPEHGYTKRDLLDYYREIAPVISPYLQNRFLANSCKRRRHRPAAQGPGPTPRRSAFQLDSA
jgi:hypothetical protein